MNNTNPKGCRDEIQYKSNLIYCQACDAYYPKSIYEKHFGNESIKGIDLLPDEDYDEFKEIEYNGIKYRQYKIYKCLECDKKFRNKKLHDRHTLHKAHHRYTVLLKDEVQNIKKLASIKKEYKKEKAQKLLMSNVQGFIGKMMKLIKIIYDHEQLKYTEFNPFKYIPNEFSDFRKWYKFFDDRVEFYIPTFNDIYGYKIHRIVVIFRRQVDNKNHLKALRRMYYANRIDKYRVECNTYIVLALKTLDNKMVFGDVRFSCFFSILRNTSVTAEIFNRVTMSLVNLYSKKIRTLARKLLGFNLKPRQVRVKPFALLSYLMNRSTYTSLSLFSVLSNILYSIKEAHKTALQESLINRRDIITKILSYHLKRSIKDSDITITRFVKRLAESVFDISKDPPKFNSYLK